MIKKEASFALPHWGDVYRLGDLPDFHKPPKVSENFSWLLDKPASSSRYVALSLEDTLSWRCACVEKYSHNRFRFGPW